MGLPGAPGDSSQHDLLPFKGDQGPKGHPGINGKQLVLSLTHTNVLAHMLARALRHCLILGCRTLSALNKIILKFWVSIV